MEEVQRAREECEACNEWFRRRELTREVVWQKQRRDWQRLKETCRRLEEGRDQIQREMDTRSLEYTRLEKEIRGLI